MRAIAAWGLPLFISMVDYIAQLHKNVHSREGLRYKNRCKNHKWMTVHFCLSEILNFGNKSYILQSETVKNVGNGRAQL